MAGIYIHIPFCSSRCIYCAFYSTTSLDKRQAYVDALVREMEMRGRRSEVSDERIETIYLGGGTPSQLTIPQLRQILYNIYKVYSPTSHPSPLTSHPSPLTPEVTIEANPDDITPELAKALVAMGVNRVSMGAQTFSDHRLRWLHRRHSAVQVREAVCHLREAGIRNISIDLMYGFPGETLDDWEHDIDAAISLDVEHLSAYCLTVEEGTALHKMLMEKGLWRMDNGEWIMDKGQWGKSEGLQMPDEELERKMYYRLIDRLEAAGYEHYEISNFAKPGYRSRHNASYWNDTPYIGIGAAAHSYDRKTRSWNVSDLNRYIERINQGERPSESETIDADTHYNDLVTVALRTREGIDLDRLSPRHKAYCLANARRHIDSGLLQSDGHHLSLTRRGLFVSDMVMTDLILDTED